MQNEIINVLTYIPETDIMGIITLDELRLLIVDTFLVRNFILSILLFVRDYRINFDLAS